MSAKKVLISYSMGLDSTTLAYVFKKMGYEVTLAYFDDGPWNSPQDTFYEKDRPAVDVSFMSEEWDMYAAWHAEHAGFKVHKIRFPQLNALHAIVPANNEKANHAEGLGLHYWVGFKMIMGMILLSHGAAFGYDQVLFGHIVSDDAYFDETAEPFEKLLDLMKYTYGDRVVIPQLRNPFREWRCDKSQVLDMALGADVPLNMTYSCRRSPAVPSADGTGRFLSCGTCENCTVRLATFRARGMIDPAPYDVDFNAR